MRILRASEYKTMPWKNGGGVTVEIAIHPPGASVDAFDWRVSMATVAQDGPFSSFPGIDRTLAIIEGNGLALAISGHEPVALTTKSTPLPFAADVPVDATLMDGAIVDLNIMTRRFILRPRRAKTIRQPLDASGNGNKADPRARSSDGRRQQRHSPAGEAG